MTPEARAAMVVRQYAQEIMKSLRDGHLPFFLETERFVVEITRSFKPTFEQQLQHMVAAHISTLTDKDVAAPVPAELAEAIEKDLLGLLETVDQQLEQDKQRGQAAKEAVQVAAALAEHRPLLAKDFFKGKGGAYPNATYKDLYLTLRKWQVAMRRQVARAAEPKQLELLSRALAESKGTQMEIPGQYLTLDEPRPEQHVKVDRVLPDLELADYNLACHRRITIRGNDSKLYHFIIEATGAAIASSDERTLQVCQLMNRCMVKEKQARRRHMKLHVRPIIGLAPRCRLVADDPQSMSLMQMLDQYLAAQGQTSDGVALKFAEQVQAFARTQQDPKMAAMNEVSDKLPETVALNYIRAIIPSNAHLWSFRKQLAVQYACLALVSHALFIPAPSPTRLVFSQLQGDVSLAGAAPSFNKEITRMQDSNERMPFRMTRMLTTLLSPVGLEGGFSAAMGAAAMSLANPKRAVKYHLCAILREEMLALARQGPNPPTAVQEQQQGKMVFRNASACADQVMQRVTALSPVTALPDKDDKSGEAPQPINAKVIELIMAAANPVEQINMPCLWHPWA